MSISNSHYLLIIVLCLCLCTTKILSGQSYFEINDFDANLDDLSLLGDVLIEDHKMNLTSDLSDQIGACWYTSKKIDLSKGFETEFTFLIENDKKAQDHGDGFAFVIQNESSIAIGSVGPGLGYQGIRNSVILEFDTYNNDEGSRNHVNINYFSKKSGTYKNLATVHQIPEITDGGAHFARIEYKDGFLTCYLDSYLFPILSTKVDLENITDSQDTGAWLGFTASTSSSSSEHSLLRWTVNEKLAAPDNSLADREVVKTKTITVKSQKIKLKVWDNNKIDGDIISLKFNDDWIFTELKLVKEPQEVNLTLTGFSSVITLYANNMGILPPNTAAISISDGIKVQKVILDADLTTSESIEIIYVPGS